MFVYVIIIWYFCFIQINGDVILTFRYNHDDSSQTILNKKREEVLTVRYDSGGRVIQFLPRSPTEGVNLTFNQLGQLVQWTYGDRHVVRGYDNKTGHLVERKLANKAIYRYLYRSGNKVHYCYIITIILSYNSKCDLEIFFNIKNIRLLVLVIFLLFLSLR